MLTVTLITHKNLPILNRFAYFKLYVSWSNICNVKFAVLTIELFLRAQLRGIKHIHRVVRLSPPPISRAFSSPQSETPKPLSSDSPFPPPPLVSLEPRFYFLSLRIWLLWAPHIRRTIQYLRLAYFISHNVFRVRPWCSMGQNLISLKSESFSHPILL